MRAIGYPVSYVAVAWPRSWWRIDVARAEYFLKKGANALAANHTREALSSLSYAYELAPHDYDIGFALASLWQINQPLLSDRIYARLLAEHPELNDRTADQGSRRGPVPPGGRDPFGLLDAVAAVCDAPDR
jgi:hypothetical protein